MQNSVTFPFILPHPPGYFWFLTAITTPYTIDITNISIKTPNRATSTTLKPTSVADIYHPVVSHPAVVLKFQIPTPDAFVHNPTVTLWIGAVALPHTAVSLVQNLMSVHWIEYGDVHSYWLSAVDTISVITGTNTVKMTIKTSTPITPLLMSIVHLKKDLESEASARFLGFESQKAKRTDG